MRPRGLEPPRTIQSTRPSTLVARCRWVCGLQIARFAEGFRRLPFMDALRCWANPGSCLEQPLPLDHAPFQEQARSSGQAARSLAYRDTGGVVARRHAAGMPESGWSFRAARLVVILICGIFAGS